MRKRAIRPWVFITTIFGIHAYAHASCNSQNFNSHADQIACEIRQTKLTSIEVDRTFEKVMAANQRFEKNPGTARGLFTHALTSDQSDWRVWITEDCKLQGDVSMGTAGSDIEQACLQNAYLQRIKTLQHIATTLGS